MVVSVCSTASVDANSAGEGGAEPSAAYLYVEYEGLRVEVGNSNTAFNSAALYYDSEVGFISSSFGNKSFDFYSFSSGPYWRWQKQIALASMLPTRSANSPVRSLM